MIARRNAADYLCAQKALSGARLFENLPRKLVLHVCCRSIPLRVSKWADTVHITSFSSEDAWRDAFVLINIEKALLQPRLITEAFDRAYLTCGLQTMDAICGALNAFLLLCKCKRRLLWYSRVFVMLRIASLPKLVVDAILSYCAINDEKILPIVVGKIVKPCSAFYDIFLDSKRKLKVPICTGGLLLRPTYQSLELVVTHKTYVTTRLIVESCSLPNRSARDVFQSPIVQTRFSWKEVGRSISSGFDCHVELYPPLLPVSCVLVCMSQHDDDASLFEDEIGLPWKYTISLDWDTASKRKTAVKWDANECFVGRTDRFFWFCVPLFEENREPIDVIFCDKFDKVGQCFFSRQETGARITVSRHDTKWRSNIDVKVYMKVWNQIVWTGGVARQWL